MIRNRFKISITTLLAVCSLASISCTRSNSPRGEVVNGSSQGGGRGLNSPDQEGLAKQNQSKSSDSSSAAMPTTLKFTLSNSSGSRVVFTSDWDGMNTRSLINGVILK